MPSPARAGATPTKFTADIAAKAAGCKPAEIFLASTGVIGEPLKAQAFDGVMEGLVARAQAGDFLAAAKAIMTTDTFPEGGDRDARKSARRQSPSTASPRAPA